MAASLIIEVLFREQQRYALELSGEVVVGRQLTPSERMGEVKRHEGSGDERLAVAQFSEVRVSRRQVLLRPTTEGVLVANPSTNPVYVDGDTQLAAGAERICHTPCRISFGPERAYCISVSSRLEDPVEMQTLNHAAPVPADEEADDAITALQPLSLAEGDAHAVRQWLQAIAEVLQSAAGSDDFFQRAVRRVVTLMGFDAAQVLLFERGQWQKRAEYAPGRVRLESHLLPSMRILERVRADRKTAWRDAGEALAGDFSQAGVESIVCAPICRRDGEVIGALYADRRMRHGVSVPLRVSPAEAMLVETLAYGLAVGLERVAHQKVAAEERVRFEQFFGRELAQQLSANPDLLSGKDANVTVLFCDIRGFSRIIEKVEPQVTVAWIQEVLEELSKCVVERGGVVVDYVGDALMAMWGAPTEQPDQAVLACHAAVAMLSSLPGLNERWLPRIHQETQVGIGVHSGIAQVGNIGSTHKLKYGAFGHTVNLASRVQGVNKYLRTSLLVTQATHDRLSAGFLSRRVCAVRVVNMEAPIDLFEIFVTDDERTRTLCQLYEKALGEYEAQQFRRAARTLGDYLPNYEEDGPSHSLLWRAVNWLVNPEPVFDRAWEMTGK